MQRIPCVVLMGIWAASLIFAASAAHADPLSGADRVFYDTLTVDGLDCDGEWFNCPDGPSSLIKLGHILCNHLIKGDSRVSVVADLTRAKPTFSDRSDLAGEFVDASRTAYCPLY